MLDQNLYTKLREAEYSQTQKHQQYQSNVEKLLLDYAIKNLQENRDFTNLRIIKKALPSHPVLKALQADFE